MCVLHALIKKMHMGHAKGKKNTSFDGKWFEEWIIIIMHIFTVSSLFVLCICRIISKWTIFKWMLIPCSKYSNEKRLQTKQNKWKKTIRQACLYYFHFFFLMIQKLFLLHHKHQQFSHKKREANSYLRLQLLYNGQLSTFQIGFFFF